MLELAWNEPVRAGDMNVIDFYNLTVNDVFTRPGSPRAFLFLLQNETDNLTVTLSAGNCYGVTPTTSFTLQLTRGMLHKSSF